jgi:hypothetical protein
MDPDDSNLLTLGLAQIAPVWLDRERTLDKVQSYVETAAKRGCQLVVFGEALVPGYPFWTELTDGARSIRRCRRPSSRTTPRRPYGLRPDTWMEFVPRQRGTGWRFT